MGFGRTGRHHHPIQILLFDNLADLALGILGAAEQVFFGIDDKRKGFGKFNHLGDIDKAGDIGTAAADKDTDPWRLAINILLRDSLLGFGYKEQVSDDTNDIVYYELNRFMSLLLQNNPNILILL